MAVYREKASVELNQVPEAPHMISASCKLLKNTQREEDIFARSDEEIRASALLATTYLVPGIG